MHPKQMETLKNLVYLFFLMHRKVTARDLFIHWDMDKVLKEYRQPGFDLLKEWLDDFRKELNGKS